MAPLADKTATGRLLWYSLDVGPIYQFLLISQSVWRPYCYLLSFMFFQHERQIWHYFRVEKRKKKTMREFHGYKAGEVKNSQELHVCVLPLQHDWALISFYSTCCSTFFLNMGWTFFCPWSSRCRKRYRRGLKTPPMMSKEMRKAVLMIHQWLTDVIYTCVFMLGLWIVAQSHYRDWCWLVLSLSCACWTLHLTTSNPKRM